MNLWRVIILPLLTSPRSPAVLRAAHAFVFSSLQLPHFFNRYFMMNDFLIFRKEEVYFILKKVMESTQKAVLPLKDESVSQVINGLWFDCSVLLPGFKSPPVYETCKEESESSSEQLDALFNKVIYVFKREISESKVTDHQNSLIYNNRDNTLIAEFFLKLGNLILSLDEVSLADLITRMDKFQQETFECIHSVSFKLLALFKNDVKKLFTFFGLCFKFKDSVESPKSFQLKVTSSLEYAFRTIIKKDGLQPAALSVFIAEKMKMSLDPNFDESIESFNYMRSSDKVLSSPRVKQLGESSFPLDNGAYEASIQERHMDFIKQNIVLIVDSNCMVRTQEFFRLLNHLCSYFRLHLGIPSFFEFLEDFKKNISLPKGLNLKILPVNAWRCYCYLHMVAENSDLHLNVLRLFPLFVRHNFLAFEAFLTSKYFDRVMYLTATLTTVAREVSLSSHSSLADALKSFMTEDNDVSEPPSPALVHDKSNRHLENFNLTFFRKHGFSFEDVLLEKAKLFSESHVLDFLQMVVANVLSVNLTKASFKLIVYLLEFAVDFVCRKTSNDPAFYHSAKGLIDQVLEINRLVTSKKEEAEFKAKFSSLKDSKEISTLLKSYFKARVSFKMILEVGACEVDLLQDYFCAVAYAGSAYMNLMIGLFENTVRTLLYKLSVKNSKSAENVQSWQALLKLILFIKSLVLSNQDRMDGTDESLSRLESILSEISSNIKINPTTIHCDIILVQAVDSRAIFRPCIRST